MSVYDKIRSMLDIVDVVSEYLPLKKVGNSYAARCPFHPDRTPSFYVSPSRQLFKCFGCGKGGDVIKFVAEYENLSYREAAKLLAERYNLPVEFDDEDSREGKYYSALRRVGEFYFELLKRSKEAKSFLLEVRRLPPSAVEEFGLGFAGNGFESVEFARREGIFEALVELKHFYQTVDGRWRDFFHGRITIPIRNPLGRVAAFGGRALRPDQKPKYKNSPNGPTFQKERALFGIDRAREAARQKEELIVVEGYFDVIRLHSAGFRNSVAPLGTGLTVHHARAIKKMAPRAVLLFDGDRAGRKAAFEAAKRLISVGVEPLFCFLPEGEDPDSFVLKNGPRALRELLGRALPAHEYLLERARSLGGERLEALARLYAELVSAVPDPVRRELLVRRFETAVGIPLEGKRKLPTFRRVNPEGLDPAEVDLLLGLLFLEEEADLDGLALSERAKELAQKILNGEAESLPAWLFELDKTDLRRRFELAKKKLFERKLHLEAVFKELWTLEERIKRGEASKEEVLKFSTLLGELNPVQRKLYERFKENLRKEKG
ncbi:MAG: DNA primase [Aquificae bacterium]|nr:DNA primase [Aquificota bacterium]